MGRNKTASQIMFADAKKFFTRDKYTNNITRRNFLTWYRKYINYCRQYHDCKTKDECKKYIQEYINHLEKHGYTASTIHSYLAPITLYHGYSLKDFKKPVRYTSEYSKSRSFTDKIERFDEDLNNPPAKYIRSVEFAKRVGCRRNDLYHICGGDLVKDEAGNYAIRLTHSKGGKYQEQRIWREDYEFIKTYFDGVPEGQPIFKREEISPRISYHYLRAQNAKRAYYKYLEMIKDPAGKAKLEKEIRARWNRLNISKKTGKPKPFHDRILEGDYVLRGKTRAFAIKNGLPVRYNRMAVLATSIFMLSHWREDVTICSYLLVI